MGQFDVTSANQATGSGIVESFAGLAADIRSANDRDTAAVAASIGLGVVVAGLDVVAVGLDPLSKLVAVGPGWLVEHVRFLRKPLDLLASDPIAVERVAERLHASAQTLRNTGRGLAPDVLAQWHGPASEEFRSATARHRARLDAAGGIIDTVGYVVASNSAVIAALRAPIRDMVTSVLGDIIATMLTAVATAMFTYGASRVMGPAKSVAAAVAWVTSMLSRISLVIGLTRRSSGRIDELVHGMGTLLAPASRSAQPSCSLPRLLSRCVGRRASTITTWGTRCTAIVGGRRGAHRPTSHGRRIHDHATWRHGHAPRPVGGSEAEPRYRCNLGAPRLDEAVRSPDAQPAPGMAGRQRFRPRSAQGQVRRGMGEGEPPCRVPVPQDGERRRQFEGLPRPRSQGGQPASSGSSPTSRNGLRLLGPRSSANGSPTTTDRSTVRVIG